MAKKIKTDLAASIRARLLAKAKAQSIDFNAVLLQYGQERFLYRLSISRWQESFMLKGALLFLAFEMPRSRPTKDIDLLGRSITAELNGIRAIMREIAEISYNDGVVFDPDSIDTQRIKENQQYEGVRVLVQGRLGTARIKIQIDIGFGDVVSYPPGKKTFPSLLDIPAPEIMIYSRETAVAEKLEALAKLGLATSRMKDFYDVLYLARNTDFSLRKLALAVKKTFTKRNTDLSLLQGVYGEQWKQEREKQIQWKSFVERNRLDVETEIGDVVDLLRPFVRMLVSKDAPENSNWDPQSWAWK
jgi:predicted nucleotidyltransferase component of viral defense system